MPNIVKVTVENADELRNASAYGTGAVVQLQSSTTETGTFTDESTQALVDATRIYTFYDADGTSSTWYRVRYENAAGTTTSDWGAAFQVGAEEAGYICSLYDVRQALDLRLSTGLPDTSEDENLLEYIRGVTRFIEGPAGCNRWIVPRPLSGDSTYRFDVDCSDRTFWMPNGIRAITTLNIAASSQPESGGTFTTATSTDYFIRPVTAARTPGWPGTRIVFSDVTTGSVTQFYAGYNTVEIVGKFGFSEVPPDLSRIGVTLVVGLHRERGSSGGETVTVDIGGTRTYERMLSGRDRMILHSYRHIVVG